MIDMKKFKLGVGPMSLESIDIMTNWSKQNATPLMLIASRNQVDSYTGYVCRTSELVERVQKNKTVNLLVCRDHCGPYFTDLDKGLTVDEAIVRCKDTIDADINNGFDLIHIDVSRIHTNQLEYGKELIEYAISKNPNIKLEFGSEDNTGIDIESSIGRLDPQLEFLQAYKDNIIYFVTQTGSLTKGTQAGGFNVARNKKNVKLVHDAGFLFKEHNADYFSKSDIEKRSSVGIDSLNIAPQIGTVHTTVLKEFASDEQWNKFSDYVYSKNYWQRWSEDQEANKDTATILSGHYCFNSEIYKDIIKNIDYDSFLYRLDTRITSVLDHYTTFIDNDNTVSYYQKLKDKISLASLKKRDPFIYK